MAEPQSTNAPLGDIANLPEGVKAQAGNDRLIPVEVAFSDSTSTWDFLLVPPLQIGERAILRTKSIMTSSPGQNRILLPFFTQEGKQAPIWETAYAYRVRSEEEIWGWAIGITIAVVIAVATVVGQCRQSDVNNYILLPTAAPSISDTATPSP